MNNSRELEVQKVDLVQEDLELVDLVDSKILSKLCLVEVVVMEDSSSISEVMLLVKEELELDLEVKEDSNIKIVNKTLEDRDKNNSLKK